MSKDVRVRDIIDIIKSINEPFLFTGDENTIVKGFSSLKNYKENTITWIKSSNNIPEKFNSTIEVAVVQTGEILPERLKVKNIFECPASKRVFFTVVDKLYVYEDGMDNNSIGVGTYISDNVKLGKNVRIGCNCVLDGNIVIGDNTRIYHNVTIVNTVNIGKNCNIESGVNIGHDGYAFTEDSNHVKTMIKHYGGVTIGNNVHIGGQTHIARGTIDDTVIEDGAKLDTLIHVAHNCIVGKNSVLLAGSIIYGSVKLGNNVQVSSAIVRNQKEMGDNSFAGMGSVVLNDVPDNITVIGVPAKPMKKG